MRRVTARARMRWGGRLRAAFTERLPLKATAIALALVLWFTVSVREAAEQVVTVRFLPSLEPGITLAERPAPIRALVRGSGRDILKLYSTPPAIRMSVGGDVGDTLVVALRPADVDLPPGVSAVVRDVQPRRITLSFRRTGAARLAPDTTPLPAPLTAMPRPVRPPDAAVPLPPVAAPADGVPVDSVPVARDTTPDTP